MSIHIRSTTSKLHRKRRLPRKDVSSQNTEGRRRGFGNFPVLKPDYTGEIATQYDGIAISEDDYTTVNFIKNKLNLDRGLVGEELQSAYNEASIAGAGVHLLVGRFITDVKKPKIVKNKYSKKKKF